MNMKEWYALLTHTEPSGIVITEAVTENSLHELMVAIANPIQRMGNRGVKKFTVVINPDQSHIDELISPFIA